MNDIYDDEYQIFIESMVPFCRCAESHRPCDGVLAGGLCDRIPERETHPDHYDICLDGEDE